MNNLLRGLCIVLLAVVFSCKSDPNAKSGSLAGLDLMKDGLPIKIKTTTNPVVKVDDLGFVKDVTIKADDNFYLQIMQGSVTTTDVAVLKAKLLEEVKLRPFFAEIVEEDDRGFIYKKQISDNRVNYDFRAIRIQGEHEYVFQTGLIGQYTLVEVQQMFAAVK